jgi:hypothetical protein
MNVFNSRLSRSFRSPEKRCVVMRVFISKYEIRMITIKEHHLHERDNTLLYSRNESCVVTNL